MAVEYDSNGIPILSGESMLSDVPQYTQELAPKLSEGSSSIYVGQYVHNLGTINAGASGPYHLTGVAFNGEVGDIWTANFSFDVGDAPGGGQGTADVRLSTAAGIAFYHPTASKTFGGSTTKPPEFATYTWKATAANDYLLLTVTASTNGVTNAQIVANGVINHGQMPTTRRQMLKEELADRRADQKE